MRGGFLVLIGRSDRPSRGEEPGYHPIVGELFALICGKGKMKRSKEIKPAKVKENVESVRVLNGCRHRASICEPRHGE